MSSHLFTHSAPRAHLPSAHSTQQANNVSKFKAVLMEDASSADETSADELA